MVTRLIGEEVHPTMLLEEKEDKVMRKIKDAGLQVEWVSNYATTGPYDYVDIFRAPDMETAMQVSMLIRSFGRAHTELWPAVEWERFKEIIADLPKFYSPEQQN